MLSTKYIYANDIKILGASSIKVALKKKKKFFNEPNK